jgi:metallo-beta-lactamase family protein
MNNPKITFCSGVGTVTGANFLLETIGGTKILIDCGLVQGEKVATDENRKPFGYDIGSIKALFITHAHLDHVGRIPKLVKEGYSGPIYSTQQTKALAEIILNDAVGILTNEAKQEGLEPLYNNDDVQAVFPLWKTINYHEVFKLTEDVEIFLKDAGHILGSSMVGVTTPRGDGNKMKILFTGDLGNSPAPLLRDTEAVGSVDYIIMESVYGDRNHESREGRSNKFCQVVKDSIARGGTLVIPTFSVDRTQILLFELNNMIEQKKIPSIPVFVDSPMAINATSVYSENTDLFNDKVRGQIGNGDNIFKFPHLEYTMLSNESRDIENTKGPKIILAGSGMSIGGRVISHERKYLPDSNSTILFVGYQSAGSLGRELADGNKKVKIYRDTIKVKAHIETLYGYSAHKDGDHLLEFVTTAESGLKEVFVVMGEPRSSMHLAQRINDEVGVKAVVPEVGSTVLLG